MLIAALPLAGLVPSSAAAAADDAQYQPGTPFTYLFDAGGSSPRPLSEKALAAKQGWNVVAEDDTKHTFQGDAVMVNDKLAVVLRRQGPGAEVYAQTAAGPRFRAVVMAAPRKAIAITRIASLRIAENNPGAVMVEADFQGDGQSGACTASYRLTTGQAVLEMTGGTAADRFFVWSNTRYLVVPDFFADDMVFSAASCDLPRFGLPAENLLLSLIRGGDALVMCVWRSREQAAHAVVTSQRADRVVRGCEIPGGREQTLWVAFLEAPGIWHEQALAPDGTKTLMPLQWKPPFEAVWRADFLGPGSRARSAQLSDFQRSAGDSDPADLAAGAKDPHRAQTGGPLIVYPLDRSRATPLTAFCPTDVLRNTLGVGPCQYVLQSEGLASETNPTPDHVMDWVEEQFAKKKEGHSAEEIRKRLDAMIEHVGQVQARIDRYAALAEDLRSLIAADEHRAASSAADAFTPILDCVQQACSAGVPPAPVSQTAADLAQAIVALIGQPNALPECQRLAGEVRASGASQQRALSKCRMSIRWLREQARMSVLRAPSSAALAQQILARVDRFLQEPQ